MNDDRKPPSLNDMNQILARAAEPPAEVKKYAPPEHRATHGAPPILGTQTPLQIIASSCKRLIWDDAEHFAATICKHIDNGHDITGPKMAKAVQAACDELLKESG